MAQNVNSPTHHKVVALEGYITPIPDLTPAMPPGHTFALSLYESTAHTDEAVQPRVADAEILLLTVSPISAATLSPAVTPNLKLIAVMASGYDVVDVAACRARGIVVSNSPACNVDTVAEHSMGLYFAVRRNISRTQGLIRKGAWVTRAGMAVEMNTPNSNLPPSVKDEVVGILGYGGVGKRIAALCQAIGMKTVLVGGRKGHEAQEGRVSFDEVIRNASVLFLCLSSCPSKLPMSKMPSL